MNVRRISALGVAALAAGGLTGGTMGSDENLGWSAPTVTVGEGDGHAVLTIQRDQCGTGRVRPYWNTYVDEETDSATAHEDYVPVHDHFVFQRCESGGEDSRTLTVPIVDDDRPEPDETFSANIHLTQVSTNDTNPLPAGGEREAKIVIRDDDGGPRLVTQDVTVKEAEGVAKVTVAVENTSEPTSVRYDTIEGTAKAGADFTGKIEESIGVDPDAPATVEIPLKVDDTPEDDETFDVLFTRGDATARATVTITDPPPPVETVATTPTTPTTTQPVETTPQPPAPSMPPVQPAAPARTTEQSSTSPIRCVSRRRFTLTLSRRYASAKVTLAGTVLKTTRKRGRLVATVDLRGRPKGRFDIRVEGRTAKGGERNETRRYRTCAPRKRTGQR